GEKSCGPARERRVLHVDDGEAIVGGARDGEAVLRPRPDQRPHRVDGPTAQLELRIDEALEPDLWIDEALAADGNHAAARLRIVAARGRDRDEALWREKGLQLREPWNGTR